MNIKKSDLGNCSIKEEIHNESRDIVVIEYRNHKKKMKQKCVGTRCTCLKSKSTERASLKERKAHVDAWNGFEELTGKRPHTLSLKPRACKERCAFKNKTR